MLRRIPCPAVQLTRRRPFSQRAPRAPHSLLAMSTVPPRSLDAAPGGQASAKRPRTGPVANAAGGVAAGGEAVPPAVPSPTAPGDHVEKSWAFFRGLNSPKLHVAPMVDQSELAFRMLCRKCVLLEAMGRELCKGGDKRRLPENLSGSSLPHVLLNSGGRRAPGEPAARLRVRQPLWRGNRGRDARQALVACYYIPPRACREVSRAEGGGGVPKGSSAAFFSC